jgi:hypothetical protein
VLRKRKIKSRNNGGKIFKWKLPLFPRFLSCVVSPTEVCVAMSGFWLADSQLSLTSLLSFWCLFCFWPWRLWRTTPRLHSHGDDSHATGPPPIPFATQSSTHRCASGCYIFFLRNDFSGRREVFRSIGTHACGHAHMNGYGGLSISASQKIGCALQLVAWAEWALGQTWSRLWGLSLRCISWCRDHGFFFL